jgi:hypothetical protein
MTTNDSVKCCNGDCNQGRDCPLHKELRSRPINWKVAWHNFVHCGTFTIAERIVLVVSAIAVMTWLYSLLNY